jgi:sugar phosphate isomerase/epimerase
MPLLGLSSLYVTLFGRPLEMFLNDLDDHELPVGEIVSFKSTILNEQNVSRLKKAGVKLTVHGPPTVKLTVHSALDVECNISNPDSYARLMGLRKLKESIDYSADIGAVAFVQHPGFKIPDVKNGWELNCDALLSLIDYGNSRGVKVLIENMAPKNAYMSTPDEFIEFIKTNNVNTHIAFDTGHAHMVGNSDEFIEKLARHFFMVHITDNDGKNDSHLNIGEGTIEWEKLVGGLQRQNFNGVYIVEATKEPMKSVNALKSLLK